MFTESRFVWTPRLPVGAGWPHCWSTPGSIQMSRHRAGWWSLVVSPGRCKRHVARGARARRCGGWYAERRGGKRGPDCSERRREPDAGRGASGLSFRVVVGAGCGVHTVLHPSGARPVRRSLVGDAHRAHHQRQGRRRVRAARRRGPAPWSQQATNIVVSKYFRGPLRPKAREFRESSVRQLIGRVVDTITEWARAERYFATEADLVAFHDDLTHLLVHQKAAFNSPVWFNCGDREAPAVLGVLHQLGGRHAWSRS